MRSIRLSLMVYFLTLTGLALGAVSVLAYQMTTTTLRARGETRRKLIEAQYEEEVRLVQQRFDESLLDQARTLANQAESQSQWDRLRHLYLMPPGGIVCAIAMPAGYLQVPLWMDQMGRNRLAVTLHRAVSTDIHFDEDLLHGAIQKGPTDYFQINSEWGVTWRSQSMGDFLFPVGMATISAHPLFEARFNDTTLQGDRSVRRVVLRVPVSRFRVMTRPIPEPRGGRQSGGSTGGGERGRGGQGQERPRRTEPRQPGPPPFRPFTSNAMSIYIQCARDVSERDEEIAAYRELHDKNLADLEEQSNTTLVWMRQWLLIIGLATFFACGMGGFALVRLGLKPLDRLSEAVSRVSERDFSLHMRGKKQLPVELRPIANRLSDTLKMLERAFSREKQAAADISHELRTPLAALMTTTEVGLRKSRTAEEYRELLEDCRESGLQMTQLVERLLALARLDAGVDQLRSQVVDVSELATQCTSLVRPLANARELTLKVNAGEKATAKADPAKLREVLNNLLHNAIQYNRPKGTVEVSVVRENGHLNLEVRDTGIGIPPEACSHIFERFYRVDASRQSDGMHAGLGLAIARGYVELMGGTISVSSTQGEGTTFRVELPA